MITDDDVTNVNSINKYIELTLNTIKDRYNNSIKYRSYKIVSNVIKNIILDIESSIIYTIKHSKIMEYNIFVNTIESCLADIFEEIRISRKYEPIHSRIYNEDNKFDKNKEDEEDEEDLYYTDIKNNSDYVFIINYISVILFIKLRDIIDIMQIEHKIHIMNFNTLYEDFNKKYFVLAKDIIINIKEQEINLDKHIKELDIINKYTYSITITKIIK